MQKIMEGAPKLPEAPPAAMKSTILLAARLLEGGEARLDPGERSGDGLCRGERDAASSAACLAARAAADASSAARAAASFSCLVLSCGSSPRRC